MIEVDITQKTRENINEKASMQARELGNLNGSIESGDGNYAGFFGELVFLEVFGGKRDNTYDYDIKHGDCKIDVKTKRRSVAPKQYYECSIADFNTEQGCDKYYFISLLDNYKKAWMLGCKDKEEYMEEATFHKEGEVDTDNGFTFKADCWNLPISELETL